jgi:hypothetical protein
MAAGQGFKTFTTGEVLTAGDVNGYLMQGINVFASNAARDAAITSPQEGQFAYTKDTNSLWYYTGSAWAASGATGDIEGVTAGTGLTGGGTSGTVTLNFDEANYGGGQWAAGKNKIINGAFYFNQRSFSSTTTANTYGFDRWSFYYEGGTVTYSAQNFTPGTAPVAGYEGKSFMRLATTGQSTSGSSTRAYQKIEDVRTFAGQTVTVSFWAKASSGTPYVGVNFIQDFGTGGSPSGAAEGLGSAVTISTSWARYSVTRNVASISGKTIGTTTPGSLNLGLWTSAGSAFASALPGFSALQNVDVDIWGVQVEAGSTATPFQTASGTIAGELALCQRYYWRHTAGAATVTMAMGISESATTNWVPINNVVPLRIPATSIDISGLNCTDAVSFTNVVGSATISSASTLMTRAVFNTSGQTSKQAIFITSQSAGSYIGVSAEL